MSLALALVKYVKPKEHQTYKGEQPSTNVDDRQEKSDRLAKLFTEVPLIAVSCAAVGAGLSYLCTQFGSAIALPDELTIFKGTHILFIGICILSFVVFLITGATKSNRLLAVVSLPIGFIVIFLMRYGVHSLGWTPTASPVPGVNFLPVVAGSACAGLLIPKPILSRSARSGGVLVGILAVLILCFGVVVAHRFDSKNEFKSSAQSKLNDAYEKVVKKPEDKKWKDVWKDLGSAYARIGATGNTRACSAVAYLAEEGRGKTGPDMCDFSRVPEMLMRLKKLGGQLDPSWVDELRKSAEKMNMPALASSLKDLQEKLIKEQ